MTITCSNCAAKVQTGSLFCSQCGAALQENSGVPTMAIGGDAVRPRRSKTSPPTSRIARLALHIVRTGEIIPVGGEGEYVIGRVSSGQSVLPDIDLEPFSAYEAGVSRLHARINVSREAILITDLGSSNGTLVNEEKVLPHQSHVLHDKDIVSLGHFSVQALIGQD